MAEILIIAFSNFQYSFKNIVIGREICVAVILMTFFPVLKLMIPAAVKGFLAVTALKQSLFRTDLARWNLRRSKYFFSHLFQIKYQTSIKNTYMQTCLVLFFIISLADMINFFIYSHIVLQFNRSKPVLCGSIKIIKIMKLILRRLTQTYSQKK
jgi:hypothetical protein